MAGHGLGEVTFILLGVQQPPLLSARPFLLLSALLPTHRGSLRHALSTSPTQFLSP